MVHCMSSRTKNGTRIPTFHEALYGVANQLVVIQGELLIWKTINPIKTKDEMRLRGDVKVFSAQSRFRLLKLIARIQWSNVDKCLMVTLTFPDQYGIVDKDTMNGYRYLFHRRMEYILKKNICVIWRIEQEIRKSGKRKGEVMPHLHLLLFGIPRIPYRIINDAWQRAIGWNEYVRTDICRAKNGVMAAKYCAKYCAKEVSASLVNKTYLNTYTGRQWGVLRSELLPLAKKEVYLVKLSDVVRDIRFEGTRRRPRKDLVESQSFTLLGEDAKEVAAIFRAFAIADKR